LHYSESLDKLELSSGKSDPIVLFPENKSVANSDMAETPMLLPMLRNKTLPSKIF
jgi:hypothetical protein